MIAPGNGARQLQRAANERAARDRRFRRGWLLVLALDAAWLVAALVVGGAPRPAYVFAGVMFVVSVACVVGKTFAIREHVAEAEKYERIASR